MLTFIAKVCAWQQWLGSLLIHPNVLVVAYDDHAPQMKQNKTDATTTFDCENVW